MGCLMEITSSGVSVYEVVLDLKQWEGMTSSEVPGFAEALIALMPSTAQHKCMSGKEGGFHAELLKGTNFGHVVEHVLLELIRLAYPEQPEFSGWTKSLGNGRYVIHYGAPGFLSGRLAAILAVEIVGKLQHGQQVELQCYLEHMRDPLRFFSRQRTREGTGGLPLQVDLDEDLEMSGNPHSSDSPPILSDWQRDNLVRTMALIEPRLPEIHQRWQDALFTFGGDFARGIEDKIELINPDQFRSGFTRGDFDSCFQGVANISQMLRGAGIPLNFVIHSAWLYKNFMQLAILEALAHDQEAQTATTWDFDDFYQNILHATVVGYRRPVEKLPASADVTVCGFRARHARRAAVLVVDDDVMARKVARSILEHRGFTTLGARDGLEAMRVLAEPPQEVGVVVLDLVMPGMSGQAVCRRLRDSHPNLRVVLCSGYPLDQAAAECLDEHEVSYLRKPFRSLELVNTVGDLLDMFVTGNHQPRPLA
jgi:CheY-like chemotaxis protein